MTQTLNDWTNEELIRLRETAKKIEYELSIRDQEILKLKERIDQLEKKRSA